jgi:hypothetical protein
MTKVDTPGDNLNRRPRTENPGDELGGEAVIVINDAVSSISSIFKKPFLV